jgi:hypothetical protein
MNRDTIYRAGWVACIARGEGRQGCVQVEEIAGWAVISWRRGQAGLVKLEERAGWAVYS